MHIELDNPIQIFDDHLNKPDNERILFSAPFGFGKTYFLKHYFNQNKDKYRPFWLSPIKYVVGQNEDIFEYIKLDIAVQLTSIKELQDESTLHFGEDLFIDQYLKNNPLEVCRLLIETIKDLDIPVVKEGMATILNAFKAREKYIEWKDKLKSETESNTEKILKFGLLQTTIRGSIFEDDTITQLIRYSLDAVKNLPINTESLDEQLNTDILVSPDYPENKKNLIQNILIIDDFDRLDPDYIFRILNILSVHQNHHDTENKFGFDKIIIVCSYDNIKKIFEHKYGEGVGFEGYIEKFYSTDVFNFNNQLAIAHYCRSNFSADLDADCLAILGTLLSQCVLEKKLSIRSIAKHQRVSAIRTFKIGPFVFDPDPDTVFSEPFSYIKTPGLYHQTVEHHEDAWAGDYLNPIKVGVKDFYLDSNDFPFLKVIQILSTIFGDYNSFKSNIKPDRLTDQYKLKDIPVDPALVPCIVRSMAALLHVCNLYSLPSKLFCSIESVRVTDYNKHYNRISHPSCEIIPPAFPINVGWNEKNQYDGKTSYYALVRTNFEKEGQEYKIKIEGMYQVRDFIIEISNFLEKYGYLGYLGLTK